MEQGTLELQKGTAVFNAAVPGRLEIAGGAVRLAASIQIANISDVAVAPPGVLDLNKKGEDFDELSSPDRVQLGNGYLNLCTGDGSSVFAGTITGSGDLTKYGTGTLRQTGNNYYNGVTTVREGTLNVDGAQDASPVTVQAGTTLHGIGWFGLLTVSCRVTTGGAGAVPGVPTWGKLAVAPYSVEISAVSQLCR